jgi:predicted nucleic acid-binding protein
LTAFVIDASVALSWYLAENITDVGDATLKRLTNGRAAAPSLWWLEVRNVLLVNERRGQLDPSATSEILANLGEFGIDLDDGADGDHLMNLARAHRLTAYDAAYLELARRLVVPLATLDRALAKAAKAEAVPLVGAD